LHGLHGEVVNIPSLPGDDWCALIDRLVGRPLTADELRVRDRMGDANWTARVTAEFLLHRKLTNEEVTERSRRVRVSHFALVILIRVFTFLLGDGHGYD